MSSGRAHGALISIYRSGNARLVTRLGEEAEAAHLEVRLWALDVPVPALNRWTHGAGPGPRTALLNALAATLPLPSLTTLVIADDDVDFAAGNLASLLDIADACGFGIAQPAHAPDSHYSHAFTRRRRWTTARLTTFVEIGPLVCIRAPWIPRLIPFPADAGMGWGLDLVWSDLHAEGCRLGIVDAVEIRHLLPYGREYDLAPERARLARLVRERGLRRIEERHRTLARWPAWRRLPPWIAHDHSDCPVH